MKYLSLHFLTSVLVLFIAPLLFSVSAATLDFDPETVTIGAGETFTVKVTIDAATAQVRGSDAWVAYDPTYLEAVGVADGTYFTTTFKDITANKIYVAGTEDTGKSKTGTGTMGTITFKAKQQSGNTTLTFLCETGSATKSTIIGVGSDSPDLITCGNNGTSMITVSGGTTVTGSYLTTPAPTALPSAGIVQNIAPYAMIGALLLLFGIGSRFVL